VSAGRRGKSPAGAASAVPLCPPAAGFSRRKFVLVVTTGIATRPGIIWLARVLLLLRDRWPGRAGPRRTGTFPDGRQHIDPIRRFRDVSMPWRTSRAVTVRSIAAGSLIVGRCLNHQYRPGQLASIESGRRMAHRPRYPAVSPGSGKQQLFACPMCLRQRTKAGEPEIEPHIR
jgi:hypothetical protein